MQSQNIWDNHAMRIQFTKMQGAGNDFVVLNETQGRLGLTAAQYRFLADRHFGVGADQILSVLSAPTADVDFEYRIHNSDGGEVEQCGNGARCFARFVFDQGLTSKRTIRVQTQKGVIEPQIRDDGLVTVDMGAPRFEVSDLPFTSASLTPAELGQWVAWPLQLPSSATVLVGLVSMGNPHAVQLVDNTDLAPVAEQGALIESHVRFAQRVNAGFMQVLNRRNVRLRVFERGAGETLACGTGACAAVVAGIRWGCLDPTVTVQTRGGLLEIEWHGENSSVQMTGPAVTVFQGAIDIPDQL
jgi:diaminopimelate epimerase